MNKLIEEFKNDLDLGYQTVMSSDNVLTPVEREFMEYYNANTTPVHEPVAEIVEEIIY